MHTKMRKNLLNLPLSNTFKIDILMQYIEISILFIFIYHIAGILYM